MAAGYGTTVEEMQRAARHVFGVNERVQADLSALRNQLAPLAGSWRGEAATAFQTLMTQWDTDARALNEALRAIGEAVRGSGQAYQRQEEQQSQSLSAIRGALG
ncbi:MAG: WXG100 family type VII secretion target [Pseudonocardia sp.]|nr:WXG100 family type VII secretion target [Pseudonocardia sp.]